jgi:hypothetical protein
VHDPADDQQVDDAIRDHYRVFWPSAAVKDEVYVDGLIEHRLPGLHIAEIRPTDWRGVTILATIGAWTGTRDDNHNLEFLALATSDVRAVRARLAQVAYYNAGPADHRLGVGHTIPIGEPWVKHSGLDHILMSLPYLWGPSLEDLALADRHVRVLWALPIYRIEAEYRHLHGLEELERKLEADGVDVLDPFRSPAVEDD